MKYFSYFYLSILSIGILFLPSSSRCEIYRCVSGDQVQYLNSPCPTNTEQQGILKSIEIKENLQKEKQEADENGLLSQFKDFDFDGFNWDIVKVTCMPEIGNDYNLQEPEFDTWVIIEMRLKNISKVPRHYGSMVLLANGTQYPSSSKSVYARYNLNYKDNDFTSFEPGSTLNTFVVFDAGKSKDYILLIKSRWGDKRIKVKISKWS